MKPCRYLIRSDSPEICFEQKLQRHKSGGAHSNRVFDEQKPVNTFDKIFWNINYEIYLFFVRPTVKQYANNFYFVISLFSEIQ